MLDFNFFLAVLIDGARSHVARGDIDEIVAGLGEVWSLLDVVVADKLEGFALNVGDGIVIDGAIGKAIDKPRGDVFAVSDLIEFAARDDFAVFGTHEKEAAGRALGLADGDRLGNECSGKCGEAECKGDVAKQHERASHPERGANRSLDVRCTIPQNAISVLAYLRRGKHCGSGCSLWDSGVGSGGWD